MASSVVVDTRGDREALMSRGFLRNFFRPPRLSGATLDWSGSWEISRPAWPLRLGAALRKLLSESGVVALEGSAIDPDVERLLQPYLIAPLLEIRPGTVYPQSKCLHIRATDHGLTTLDGLVNSFAPPQVCSHLYAYEGSTLLLEWHDAFGDPIHIAGTVSPDVIAALCAALGVGPAKPPSHPVK
jgi:hypothetical protein